MIMNRFNKLKKEVHRICPDFSDQAVVGIVNEMIRSTPSDIEFDLMKFDSTRKMIIQKAFMRYFRSSKYPKVVAKPSPSVLYVCG